MATNDCFYTLLGVSKTATLEAIKKAYRIAARNTHPDRCGASSTEKFQAVQQAYEILSDAELRAIYDRFGRDAVLRAAAQRAGSSSSTNDAASVEEMLRQMFGAAQSANDRTFFTPFGGGGGMFFHHGAAPAQPREVTQEITLEDVFEGRRVRVKIPQPNSELSKDEDPQVEIECGSLSGFGGFRGERTVIMQDRHGKVILRLRLLPHSEWQPAGDLILQKNVTLSLTEALLGTTVTFHLPNDDRTAVEHRLTSVTQPGAKHIHRRGKWQFVLRFDVELPKQVSSDKDVRDALRTALEKVQ